VSWIFTFQEPGFCLDEFHIKLHMQIIKEGLLWSWSYGSWIYNHLCNECLSPLKLWVRISLMARCTRYNILW